MPRSANKTVPTSENVLDFLGTISNDQRRSDSLTLLEMMREISGHEPKMWGTSIVGFGSYHYKSEAGREGDMCAIGFSPRKAALTLYIYEGFNDHGDLLTKLGKYTTSLSYPYIRNLNDIEVSVLRELLSRSYKNRNTSKRKPTTVDEYEMAVPERARKRFKELRALMQATVPYADEVISYAIPAYKIDNKRSVVYISGWKDHVAMYPVPRDEILQKDLKPYIKGKGTLWFGLDEQLPTEIIKKAVEALVRSRV